MEALDSGADDYVTKPFGPRELIARLQANLRRIGPEPEPALIAAGDLEIDLAARTVRRAGREIHLTKTEFDLLGLLHGLRLPFRSESAPTQTPNMIWLYRRPMLDYWAEHDEALGDIITHVLVHEIGHHFGLSDADMEALEAAAD